MVGNLETSTPSIAVPVNITRSVKRSLEEGLLLMHSKKRRGSTSKFHFNTTAVHILYNSSESEKPRYNTPKKASKVSKNQAFHAKSKVKPKKKREKQTKDVSYAFEWEEESENEGEDEILNDLEAYTGISIDRILNFTQRAVIRGRVRWT